MAKLHELLAVEGDLEGLYRKILKETAVTFTKRADHFQGSMRTLDLFADDAPKITPEHKELDSTVGDKLDYQQDHVIRYLDVVLQKELTNGIARADIVIDGTVVAKELPATFLLGLETKLKHLREVYTFIPTLSPGRKWETDEQKGTGIYKDANPEEKFQTEKVIEPVVLYEATKEHPAQVREVSKVNNIGKFTKTNWSGMLTPADKSVILGKLDKLLRAVKKARQRANATKVVTASVGKELFNFINS